MAYWLMKSEPEVFSISDLKKVKKTLWEGVRNYQARNFMMKDMKVGDEVLFYHSNADPSGIAGLAKVSAAAVPDPTQFDRKSEYFDPRATHENPRWYCVEITFVNQFAETLPLEKLRPIVKLKDMALLAKGQRLSVQVVQPEEWKTILSLAGTKA